MVEVHELESDGLDSDSKATVSASAAPGPSIPAAIETKSSQRVESMIQRGDNHSALAECIAAKPELPTVNPASRRITFRCVTTFVLIRSPTRGKRRPWRG